MSKSSSTLTSKARSCLPLKHENVTSQLNSETSFSDHTKQIDSWEDPMFLSVTCPPPPTFLNRDPQGREARLAQPALWAPQEDQALRGPLGTLARREYP